MTATVLPVVVAGGPVVLSGNEADGIVTSVVELPGWSSVDDAPPAAANAAPPVRARRPAVVMVAIGRVAWVDPPGGCRSSWKRHDGLGEQVWCARSPALGGSPASLGNASGVVAVARHALAGRTGSGMCPGWAMTIHVDTDGPIVVVTIDRPERRNAVDREHAEELARAFRRFDEDDSLAVAVLTGAGGAFCSGADLKASGRGPRQPGRAGRRRADGADSAAAVQARHRRHRGSGGGGWAGAGAVVRPAGRCRGATLGVYCRRWGVPLIDGDRAAPRLIGHSRAMDLILTGRRVDGEEALAMGLVNRVASDGEALAAAVALGEQLAAFPQRCLRSDRRSAIDQWSLDERAQPCSRSSTWGWPPSAAARPRPARPASSAVPGATARAS